MDYTIYKVKHLDLVGDIWVIESYRYGAFVNIINIEFNSEELANMFCHILQEEVIEAYGDGQISTY